MKFLIAFKTAPRQYDNMICLTNITTVCAYVFLHE